MQRQAAACRMAAVYEEVPESMVKSSCEVDVVDEHVSIY
jgi:hypothetical protein